RTLGSVRGVPGDRHSYRDRTRQRVESFQQIVSGVEAMNSQNLFACLVASQAMHSLEETWFGLYHRLPYINWVDTFVAGGAFVFFVLGNTAFVLFGCWCYFARVKTKKPGARFFVMVWVIIEILNGILHPVWSLIANAYIPGTATAPVLLLLACLLFWRSSNEERADLNA
ncbi:MAG: hypothetical protein ACE5OQ_10650, partial [Woeseia sp.]